MTNVVTSDPLRDAGLVSVGALALLAGALSLAFYDLSNSNKPHELRYETLVFSMLGGVVALALWTIFLLIKAYRQRSGRRWTGRDRASALVCALFLGAPIYMTLVVRFLL